MKADQAQPIIEQFILQVINDERGSKPGKQYFPLGFKFGFPLNLMPINSDSPSSVKLELATANSTFAELGLCFTFHKEATFESGQVKTRQNIYGAIQFLKSPFSSFQIIRATTEVPTHEMLSNITLVVKSFK